MNSKPISIPRLRGVSVLKGRQLEMYLSDFNPEEQRSAKDLWKLYASKKDLIDFKGNQPHAQSLRLASQ